MLVHELCIHRAFCASTFVRVSVAEGLRARPHVSQSSSILYCRVNAVASVYSVVACMLDMYALCVEGIRVLRVGQVVASLEFTCALRCVCYRCAVCAAYDADVVSCASASVPAFAERSDVHAYARKAVAW